MTWTCPNCGHDAYRHVTDDIFRCLGCRQDISHTVTTLRETTASVPLGEGGNDGSVVSRSAAATPGALREPSHAPSPGQWPEASPLEPESPATLLQMDIFENEAA